MTPETYVNGSILLSVIVVAILYFSRPSAHDFMKCPRCGAEMREVGSGALYSRILIHVVPEIQRVVCPQSGDSERLKA